jgi:hypothetical protein
MDMEGSEPGVPDWARQNWSQNGTQAQTLFIFRYIEAYLAPDFPFWKRVDTVTLQTEIELFPNK